MEARPAGFGRLSSSKTVICLSHLLTNSLWLIALRLRDGCWTILLPQRPRIPYSELDTVHIIKEQAPGQEYRFDFS